jgi:hypothetical protein
MIISIIISLLVGAVGGFVGGILVGRKNAKAVNQVVGVANTVTSGVKTVAADVSATAKKL